MASKEGNIFKRITGAVEHPLVRGFAGAGIKLVEEGVELAGKRMRAQVKNLSSKSPEAEPVLITDLTIEEQREREEKIELEVALRDVTPEGCRVNELMIKGIFLDFERLKHYSKKDQKELRDLYKKRSFSSLSRENKFMVIEELAKF